MTISEASKNYQIPLDIMEEYKALGLCGMQVEMGGDWVCSDRDLEQLNLLILLHASGFDTEEIQEYLAGQTAEAPARRLRLLARKRNETLEEIHQKELQLDNLDYLRYELQKESSAVPQ